MNKDSDAIKSELKVAKQTWRNLSGRSLAELRALLKRHKLSVVMGEITSINNHWYVTHSGLLQLAFRHRCCGIMTVLDKGASDPVTNRWVFKAVVHKSPDERGFVGYGDADPSNVSSLVHGAELRTVATWLLCTRRAGRRRSDP